MKKKVENAKVGDFFEEKQTNTPTINKTEYPIRLLDMAYCIKDESLKVVLWNEEHTKFQVLGTNQVYEKDNANFFIPEFINDENLERYDSIFDYAKQNIVSGDFVYGDKKPFSLTPKTSMDFKKLPLLNQKVYSQNPAVNQKTLSLYELCGYMIDIADETLYEAIKPQAKEFMEQQDFIQESAEYKKYKHELLSDGAVSKNNPYVFLLKQYAGTYLVSRQEIPADNLDKVVQSYAFKSNSFGPVNHKPMEIIK